MIAATRRTMQGDKRIFVMPEYAVEAALIPDLEVIPSPFLSTLYKYYTGLNPIPIQELIKADALQYHLRNLMEGRDI